MDIYEIYTKNFKKRSIGLEYEFPLVNNEMKAPTYNEMKSLFNYLKGEKIYDGKNVVGIKNNGIITTDYGACTLEINYPPAKDLFKAKENYSKIMKEVNDALEKSNLKLLYYGIQPLSFPSEDLIAPKKRYKTLTKRFGIPRVLYHTINASAQVHIGLRQEEMIDAVNELNKISPVLIDIFANSKVWWSNANEPRELFWDWVVHIPQDKYRKGIPRKFKNLEDYLNEIFSFEPIMTLRKDYGEFKGLKSFKEYLQKGGKIYEPGTNNFLADVMPKEIDIYAHDSFIWWDARLKSAYGTIELRCCSQQPKSKQMLVPTLALGLIENIDELKKIKIKDPRKARMRACLYGGLPFKKEVYEIAKTGLKKRGLGEEKFID